MDVKCVVHIGQAQFMTRFYVGSTVRIQLLCIDTRKVKMTKVQGLLVTSPSNVWFVRRPKWRKGESRHRVTSRENASINIGLSVKTFS